MYKRLFSTYRTRRDWIASQSKIPGIQHIPYNILENKTWSVIFNRLYKLYDLYASNIHNKNLEKLLEHNIYTFEKIPQLATVNNFLNTQNNWNIIPVSGLLESRIFLNKLAERTFCSTQYIRSHKNPFFTPEPDICHELLGHVPMFLDRDFADFSEAIGKLSLNSSDDLIKKLVNVYWFTIEFGLIRENGSIKAFGSGLLSSIEELQTSVAKSVKKDFDIELIANIKSFPTNRVQDQYFVINSFEDLKYDVRKYFKFI